MYLFLEPNQTWVALPLTVTFLPSSVTVKLLYRSMMHLALLKNLIVISDWIRFSKNNQTHFSSVAGVHHTLRFPSESHCLNNHLGQPAEEEKTQVWSLPCLVTPSLRALVEFRTNYWICPNWYMDFSKLLMILSKLIHGFLWVVTWICQRCYIELVTWICDLSKLFSVFLTLCHTKPSWSLIKISKIAEAFALS